MVRREVLTMLKGTAVATLPPTFSLVLIDSGWSQAYCGMGDYGVGYLVTCWPFDAVVPGGPMRYVVTTRASPRHPAEV